MLFCGKYGSFSRRLFRLFVAVACILSEIRHSVYVHAVEEIMVQRMTNNHPPLNMTTTIEEEPSMHLRGGLPLSDWHPHRRFLAMMMKKTKNSSMKMMKKRSNINNNKKKKNGKKRRKKNTTVFRGTPKRTNNKMTNQMEKMNKNNMKMNQGNKRKPKKPNKTKDESTVTSSPTTPRINNPLQKVFVEKSIVVNLPPQEGEEPVDEFDVTYNVTFPETRAMISLAESKTLIESVACSENLLEIVFIEPISQENVNDMFPKSSLVVVDGVTFGITCSFTSPDKPPVARSGFLIVSSAAVSLQDPTTIFIDGKAATLNHMFQEKRIEYRKNPERSRRRLQQTARIVQERSINSGNLLDPVSLELTCKFEGEMSIDFVTDVSVIGFFDDVVVDLTVQAGWKLDYSLELKATIDKSPSRKLIDREGGGFAIPIRGVRLPSKILEVLNKFLPDNLEILDTAGLFIKVPFAASGGVKIDVPQIFTLNSNVGTGRKKLEFGLRGSLDQGTLDLFSNFLINEPGYASFLNFNIPSFEQQTTNLDLSTLFGINPQVALSTIGLADASIGFFAGMEVGATYFLGRPQPPVGQDAAAVVIDCEKCHNGELSAGFSVKDPFFRYTVFGSDPSEKTIGFRAVGIALGKRCFDDSENYESCNDEICCKTSTPEEVCYLEDKQIDPVASATCCNPENLSPGECCQDSDCEEREQCLAQNKCGCQIDNSKGIECCEDNDCRQPLAFVCSKDNKCVCNVNPLLGVECCSNADCPPSEKCSEYQCIDGCEINFLLGIECCSSADCPGSQKCSKNQCDCYDACCEGANDCSTGGGTGDPHLWTFDRLDYSCQAGGDFILARSDDGLEVQSRFTKKGSLVSLSTGFAARGSLNEPTIQVMIKGPGKFELVVDGTVQPQPTAFVDSKVRIIFFGREFRVFFKESKVGVNGWYREEWGFPHFLGVQVTLPRRFQTANVRGLLGSPDGNPLNDWTNPQGDAITIPENRIGSEAYEYCRLNWCITNENESLFIYEDDLSFNLISEGCRLAFPGATNITRLPDGLAALCGVDEPCLIDGVELGLSAALGLLESEAQIAEAQPSTATFTAFPAIVEEGALTEVYLTVDLTDVATVAIDRFDVYRVALTTLQREGIPVATLEDARGSGTVFASMVSEFIEKAGLSLSYQAVAIVDGAEDNSIVFTLINAVRSFSSGSGIAAIKIPGTGEACNTDSDCLNGLPCGRPRYILDNPLESPLECCSSRHASSKDGNLFCHGQPVGAACFEDSMCLEDAYCFDGLCRLEKRKPGELCDSRPDCFQRPCAREFYNASDPTSVNLVCCTANLPSRSLDSEEFCQGQLAGAGCFHDKMCESGACLEGICLAQKLQEGEFCDSYQDCAKNGCGREYYDSSDPTSAEFICCPNGRAMPQPGTMGAQDWFCSGQPEGAGCLGDDFCESDNCVESVCRPPRTLSNVGEPCSTFEDCVNGFQCGRPTYVPDDILSVPLTCCPTRFGAFIDISGERFIFCPDQPAGAACFGSSLCKSFSCVDDICQ